MIYAVIFLATENKIRRNGDQSRKKKNKDTTMIKNKRTQKKKKNRGKQRTNEICN